MEGISGRAVGRCRRSLRPAEGYLTVFLALTVAVLLTLILTLVEGARVNAIRMKTEVAGNIAVRSVLGEFNRELLRQYDLYFVDTSYGTGSASVENVEQHLRSYMAKNLETTSPAGFGIAGDFTGTRLEDLQIAHTAVSDLSHLALHPGLKTLNIAAIPADDLSPVLALPQLQTLVVSADMLPLVKALGEVPFSVSVE